MRNLLEVDGVGGNGITESVGIACHLAIDASQTSDYAASTPIWQSTHLFLHAGTRPLNIEFTPT